LGRLTESGGHKRNASKPRVVNHGRIQTTKVPTCPRPPCIERNETADAGTKNTRGWTEKNPKNGM